ncbi:MAG: ATP-binding protein [Erysipelotrichaceae bacterium]|nr:ATP-binding protein [Erysipelotrichaceae bacterium]
MILKAQQLHELSVFCDLYKDGLFSCFVELVDLHAQYAPADAVRTKMAEFAGRLYKKNTQDWAEYLEKQVLACDTCCAWFAGKSNEIPRLMLDAAMKELEILSMAGAVKPEHFESGDGLAQWIGRPIDLQAEYLNRLLHIPEYGTGDFALYTMFRLEDTDRGFEILPVSNPDPVRLSDLIGYQLQHETVLDNTKLLLEGRIASNILLYGDAGTGKSATVKAVVNELAGSGLRLIEVTKNQLHWLPRLLDELTGNPLKFIIFIDDLSFQDNDDDFAALKAVLEGSVSARSMNTVIYATTNRRHIVRETFSARGSDDIHRNDTMQETVSLSERFGIKLLFEKPNADTYFEIVQVLAKEKGVSLSDDELKLKAEQFALRKSGRSARAARQLAEQLAAQEGRDEKC